MQTFFCVCIYAVVSRFHYTGMLPPPPPWNAENVWSQSMPRCHFLVSRYLGFESNLEDTSPCLKGEWLSVQTGGGGIRAGRWNRRQPFAFYLFPCTIQALWSCWKTYFLYHFVWLNNHLWTSVSAPQQIRVQKSYFVFNWKIIILSDLSFS